ncbi:MAG: endolytic transglycosylase MltG [Chloroflexi bacterium]|nr:endolytic transglycosylase MltG [Chloroflexota bacterium]
MPFSVQPGDTAGTVGVRLQRAGLIADAELFRLLARARDVESHLEVGDYQLQRGMSMDEILTDLQSGRVKSNSVRLIEGWRIEEMAAAAEKQGAGTAAAFVAAAKAGSYKFAFLSDRPKGSTLEGFLFPDTYDVPSNATAEQIIGFALTARTVGPSLVSRAIALPAAHRGLHR